VQLHILWAPGSYTAHACICPCLSYLKMNSLLRRGRLRQSATLQEEFELSVSPQLAPNAHLKRRLAAGIMIDTNSPEWQYLAAQQPITLIAANGSTIQSSLKHLNTLHYNKVSDSLSQGFAIGFPSMLLIILFLVSDSSKYRRPGFILNAICLFLVCFESIFVHVMDSGLNVASRIIYKELRCGQQSYVILVVQAILYPCILASLVLQIRIVYVDWPQARFIITIILAVLTVGLEGCCIAYRLLMCSRPYPSSISVVYLPPKAAFDTSFTCVVCICCALLLFKLCFTIKTSVGLRGFLYFRPLQVLLVTIFVCLIVPGNSPLLAFNLIPLSND
jgi:Fungal pheromone mating factor STE2 GPCR